MSYKIGSELKGNQQRQQKDDVVDYRNQKGMINIKEDNYIQQNSYTSPHKELYTNLDNDNYNESSQKKQFISFSEKKQASNIKSLDQLLFDQSIHKIKQSQTNYKNIISNLSTELDGYKKTTEKELTTSKKQIKSLNEQMSTQTGSLESQNMQLKEQLHQLSQDQEYQKSKNVELIQQKQKLISIIEDLQQQNTILLEDKKKQDIQSYQQKSQQELKMQKLETQIVAANQKLSSLELDKRDLQQKFLNASRGIQDVVVQDLENQLQKIDIENSLLKNEMFDLKLSINEKNRKIEQLELEISSKQNQHETLHKSIEQLNNKISEYQRESIQKDQQILNIINQSQKVNQNDQLHYEQVQKLSDKIQQQEQEIIELRKAIVEKTAHLEIIDQDYQEFQLIKKQIKKIQQSNDKLSQELDQKTIFVQVLLDEIERQKKQLQDNQVTYGSNNYLQDNRYNSYQISPNKSSIQQDSPIRSIFFNKSTPSKQSTTTTPQQNSQVYQGLYVNTHSRPFSQVLSSLKFDQNEIMSNIKISRQPISESKSQSNQQHPQNYQKDQIESESYQNIANQLINQEEQTKQAPPSIQQFKLDIQENQYGSFFKPKSNELSYLVQEIQEKPQDQEQSSRVSTIRAANQGQQELTFNTLVSQDQFQSFREEKNKQEQPSHIIEQSNSYENTESEMSTNHNNIHSKNNNVNKNPYLETIQSQLITKDKEQVLNSSSSSLNKLSEFNKQSNSFQQPISLTDQEKIQLIRSKRKSEIDNLKEALQFGAKEAVQEEDQNSKSAVLDNLINKNEKLFKRIQENIVKATSMNNIFSDSQISSSQNFPSSMHNSVNLNRSNTKKSTTTNKNRFTSNQDNQEYQEEISMFGSGFYANIDNQQSIEGQSVDLNEQRRISDDNKDRYNQSNYYNQPIENQYQQETMQQDEIKNDNKSDVSSANQNNEE